MPAPVHDKDGSDFGAKGILYLVAISGCLLSGFALLFSLQDFGAWSIQAMAYLTLFVLYCIRLFRAEKTRRARGRRRAMAVSGIVAIALTFAASGPAGLVFFGGPAAALLVLAVLPAWVWPKESGAAAEPPDQEECPDHI